MSTHRLPSTPPAAAGRARRELDLLAEVLGAGAFRRGLEAPAGSGLGARRVRREDPLAEAHLAK